MKIGKLSVIVLLLVFLLSCGDNGPRVYTSISGAWRCQEINPFLGNRVYLVEIDRKASDTTQYVITNFYDSGDLEYIVVKLKNGQLTLAQQPTADLSVKSFTGTLVDTGFKRIELTYKVYDGLRDVSSEAVLTRQ